jgi:mono/diheme cytochrome c family protein
MYPKCTRSESRISYRAERLLAPLELGWAGSLAFLLLATLLVRPAQATHELTQTEGWRLVKERCLLCHYVDRTEAKFAPTLKDLFQRQTLMNGKPVNDQTVAEWIADGGPTMPAFKYTLTPQQIQLIVTFLKQGAATNLPTIRNTR